MGSLQGQERALDVGDDLELAFDNTGGLSERAGQGEVAGGAPEEVAHPEDLGDALVVEAVGLAAHGDDHVQAHALVVVGDGHDAAHATQVLGSRVVFGNDQVVDNAGLVAVDEIGEDAAFEAGEAVAPASRGRECLPKWWSG